MRRTSGGCDGGFALHEAFWRRVAGVSNPRVVQFPPIGGGAAVTCGGVVPKSQTTSAKNPENGLLVAKRSAFGRNDVCRGVLFARGPLNMRVNPFIRT